MNRQSLRKLVFTHVLLATVLTLGLLISGHGVPAASFACGALGMEFSFMLMAWSTWRLLNQKTIALTCAIIVIKYAVLLASLYYLAQCEWLNPLGGVAGVFSFMVAALLFAVFEYKFDLKKETKQIGRAF